MKIDVRFINTDTGMTMGRSLGNKIFIAFSPYPKCVKSKAAWIGVSPENEAVARTLARYFTQIADKYRDEAVAIQDAASEERTT